MRVRVRAFATLRDALGATGVALSALEAEYEGVAGELLEDDCIQSSVTVLHEGRRVPDDDPGGVELSHGDELVLTPPVTGG